MQRSALSSFQSYPYHQDFNFGVGLIALTPTLYVISLP
jgi:hypothetical protein